MGLFDFLKRNNASSSSDNLNLGESILGHSSAERINLTPANIESVRKRFVAFDVETTGLSPEADRIVELGAVRFEDGVAVEKFSTLVNPDMPISASASAVNHITNDMLQSAPKEKEAYENLVAFLGEAFVGKTYMCAHNAKFDFEFLCNTLSRLGYNAEIKYFDTLSLSKRLIKGLDNYKQKTVAQFFCLSNSAEHRAEFDAEVCGEIFCKLMNSAEDMIKEKKVQIEKRSPSDEELEVCAVIQAILSEAGKDISLLGFRKNSGGYVDVSNMYSILKFKFAKKGKYIILDSGTSMDNHLPKEPCSASEGGTAYVRVYFSKPSEIKLVKNDVIKAYDIAFESLEEYRKYYSSHTQNEEQNWMESMTTLSNSEVERLLKLEENRDYIPVDSVVVEPSITRSMVQIKAIHNRCPLSQIKNIGDWEKGFDAGFKYYERAEKARKEGLFTEAIENYDKARYNGYEAPALYDGYAKTYHKLKDYDNEIIIIEEFLSRNTYGKSGQFEARRASAIKALYARQESERKTEEKALEKERKKQAEQEKTQIKEKAQRGRAICQLDDEGNIVAEYESLNQAIAAVGVSSKSIRDAANGVQKHAGGYCWKYKDQFTD